MDRTKPILSKFRVCVLKSFLLPPPTFCTFFPNAIYFLYYYFSWIMDVEGPPDTLYDGEKFSLSFQFNARYPFDSPIVLFVGDNIPIHPHVYSNGHICLSILTEGWSPALSVESVCLSIMSMLASAKEKVRILLFWIMLHQNFLSFKFRKLKLIEFSAIIVIDYVNITGIIINFN